MFTVWLTFTDGKKREVQLYGDSRGEKGFEVRYTAGAAVEDVGTPFDKRCSCTG